MILTTEDLIELLEQVSTVLTAGHVTINRNESGWRVYLEAVQIETERQNTLYDALVATLKKVRPKGTLPDKEEAGEVLKQLARIT